MKHIQHDSSLQLQLVVTGMHLSKEFGSTHKMIEQEGFRINKKIDILKSDFSETGTTKAIGLGCQLFADAFRELKPDIVVILGDRFEMLSAAIAAYVAKIAIAHIHGGERTEGVIDEGIRHSITKMSTIHFAATKEYRNRIIQMGEAPERVYCYGAPVLDYIHQVKTLSKEQLQDVLNFNITGKIAIATYHPVTLEKGKLANQIKEFLAAIRTVPLQVIFTKANADPDGISINEALKRFCDSDPHRYKLVDNLGQKIYYSCLKNFDLMVGNSSSGLIEAPSFRLPVVNIGDRQKNRVQALNIINTNDDQPSIQRGLRKALSSSFKHRMKSVKNPYEPFKNGNISYKIKETIKNLKLTDELLKKSFYDLKPKRKN